MLDCFFADELSAIVKETCNVLLKNCAFAYDKMKSKEREKAFWSTFVLQLLTNAHLRVCFGSVEVPALQLSAETNRARGAIALCVAAVICFDYIDLRHWLTAHQLECAFKFVKANVGTDKGKGSSSQKSSSKPSGTDNTFSEQHWGGTTSSYFEAVANHDDPTLLDIVKSADALLEDKDDSSLDDTTELQESATDEIDTHKLMCKPMTAVIFLYWYICRGQV